MEALLSCKNHNLCAWVENTQGGTRVRKQDFFFIRGEYKEYSQYSRRHGSPLFFEVVVEWLFFIFWGEGCFGASSDGKAEEGSVGVKMRGNVQLDVL